MRPRPVAAPLVPLSLLAVSLVGDGVSPSKAIGLDKLREDLTARLGNATHGGDAE